MVMQRRRVPVLDSFFDRVNMLLWPRFKAAFDNNLKRWNTFVARSLYLVLIQNRNPFLVFAQRSANGIRLTP